MEDIPSERSKVVSTLRSWRRSRLVRLGVLLTFLLVVGLVSAPFAIGFALERIFLVQGADRVSVQNVDFNPFAGTLTIEGLHVSRDRARALRIGRASANFAWWGLLGRQIRFQTLVIERSDVRVDRVAEAGIIAAGILLKRAEGVEEPTEGKELNFGVDRLEIVDSRVRYQDPAVQSVLQIDEAVLTRLASWEGRSLARLDLEGRWNDGRVTIGADFDAFADPPRADARILLEGLSLEPWSPLLGLEDATMQGRLWLDLHSELIDDDGRMRLKEQGTLRIEQPRLGIAGGTYGAAEAELTTSIESLPFASPQLVTLDGQLVLSEAEFETQPAKGKAGRLAWKGQMKMGVPEDGGDPQVQGLLTLDAVDVDANGTRVAGQSIVWDGRVRLQETGPALKGRLDLKRLNVDAADNRSAVASVAWDGRIQLGESEQALQGVLKLDELEVDAGGNRGAVARVAWDGNMQLGGSEQALQGVLKLDELRVDASEPRLMAVSDGAQWEGGARLTQDGPSVDGALEIERLRIDDPARQLRLADIGRIVLREMDVKGQDRLAIARSTLEGLRLVQPSSDPEARSLLEAESLAVTDFRLEDLEALSIDTVFIEGMTALVRRKSDRALYLIHDLVGAGGDEATQPPAQPSAKKPIPPVRINRIEVTGESAVLLEDESVTPVFRARLPVVEATVSGIDSTRADQYSDLSLRLKGKYSELIATGQSKLLSARPTLSVESQINSLELPPLSPFTVQTSGYAIRGGRADIDLRLSVVEGQMDGKTDLLLHNVSVAPQDVGKAEEVNKQLKMPLNLALSVLKDKKGDIRMQVPIKGDIRDPAFSFRGAFNQAMIKATRLASLQYLKLALGPYGVAVTLAQVGGAAAGKAARYVKLKPVIFVPGKEETESPERDYGEHLGKVLRDRPGLELNVCSVYATVDMAALELPLERDKLNPAQLEQLTALATTRAARVKEYMVTEERIEPERLFVCNPSFDPAPDAQPRVELGI